MATVVILRMEVTWDLRMSEAGPWDEGWLC